MESWFSVLRVSLFGYPVSIITGLPFAWLVSISSPLASSGMFRLCRRFVYIGGRLLSISKPFDNSLSAEPSAKSHPRLRKYLRKYLQNRLEYPLKILYNIKTNGLSKGLRFDSPLIVLRQPVFPQTPVKRGFFQACPGQQFRNRQFPALPLFYHIAKIIGWLYDRTPEPNAPYLRRRYALRLPFPCGFAFVLRHER